MGTMKMQGDKYDHLDFVKYMHDLGVKPTIKVLKAGVEYKEELDKEDETSIKKVIKGLKKAVDAHSGQVKSLTKDIQDETDLEEKTAKDVDETLDKIREANVGKGRTMRNILADIWNIGEGKNVFAKTDEAVSSAQQAAIAISKKEKEKKEEDEKGSSKTMTGKKATKVEIEPEVK